MCCYVHYVLFNHILVLLLSLLSTKNRMIVYRWKWKHDFRALLTCLLKQGVPGSDGPPGKDGMLGIRVRQLAALHRTSYNISLDFTLGLSSMCLSSFSLSSFPSSFLVLNHRETEEMLAQRVWLGPVELQVLLDLLVQLVVLAREENQYVCFTRFYTHWTWWLTEW